MNVELRNQYGIQGKRKVNLERWRVFVDGQCVGYIAWKRKQQLLFTSPFNPLLIPELEQSLSKDLDCEVTSNRPPKPIDDQEETGFHDDFDESSFT